MAAQLTKARGTGIRCVTFPTLNPAPPFGSQSPYLAGAGMKPGMKGIHSALQMKQFQDWESSISSLNCSSLKADICHRKTWGINATEKSIYGLIAFIQQTLFGPGQKA